MPTSRETIKNYYNKNTKNPSVEIKAGKKLLMITKELLTTQSITHWN